MFLPPITYPLFYLPAKLYEGLVQARARLYARGWLAQRQLPAPVISVGNLTVGGTGKTPCVAWLAQALCAAGKSVAILSRGYKRTGKGRVEVSDGQRLLADAVRAGDEPFLLAQSCPGVRVVADADRYEAGCWLAERASVEVFLLDDGYQHLRVRRDLNVLLVDATEDLAAARMVPFGRLREPLTALQRADVVIVTRADQAFDRARLEATLRRYASQALPVFYAAHVLTRLRRLPTNEVQPLASLARQRVAAFAGIARPPQFFDDLRRHKMQVVGKESFADHHRYSWEEFESLCLVAQQVGATALVTTEKDAANLSADWLRQAPLPVYAAQLEFRCAEEAALLALVQSKLGFHGLLHT